MPASVPFPPPIDAAQDALFLDFDGTLAPIAPTPDDVVVAMETQVALSRLQRVLGGRLAVVSGRNLATLMRLLGAPACALAGVHGLERRSAAGKLVRHEESAGMHKARMALAETAAREPRLLIEDKGLGMAIHFRAAPELEPLARRTAAALADAHGLVLQPGKMVFEIRERGGDKGAAVRAFMAEPPFLGARPIFVGDDETDECAFDVAAELGGFGVLVGAPRETAARYRLPDVEAVRIWLEAVEVAA